ncbi:MAG: alpha/beta hydrolase [Betaproteobacteria bacterium]|nr:alpha/beta hydrolase [Betaproteobacteria bacterium]
MPDLPDRHRRDFPAADAPALFGPDAIVAVPYGDETAQKADLHLPAASRAAVVCLLHGGFWRKPWGREQMGAIARDLVARGFAVWNIGYRRQGEAGGGWPGTLDDAVRAMDHLAELAARGAVIDLGRVIVAGHSAGGQLALACGSRNASRTPSRVRPLAVAALGALTDLHDAFARDAGGGAVREFLGGSPSAKPEDYEDASPARLLPLGIPQLVVHGDTDQAVPVESARAYVVAARRAGDRVGYDEVRGGGHEDHLDPSSLAHGAFVRWLDRVVLPG